MNNKSKLSLKDLLDSNTMGRAFAITLVVMGHLKFVLPYEFTWSSAKLGVSLFTFYSGLLHQYNYLRAGGNFDTKKWLFKRLFRIYPIYWIGILFTITVGTLANNIQYSGKTILANIIGISLFLHMPLIDSGYCQVFWYIGCIIFCYLLFILTKSIKRKIVLVISSLSFSSMLIIAKESYALEDVYFLFSLAFPMFFVGMWLAHTLEKRGAIPFKPVNHFILGLLCLFFSGILLKSHSLYYINTSVKNILGLFCIVFSTIFISFCIGDLFIVLRKMCLLILKPIVLIGSISFVVYCIHESMFIILDKLNSAGYKVLVNIFIYFMTLGVISWVIYKGQKVAFSKLKKYNL